MNKVSKTPVLNFQSFMAKRIAEILLVVLVAALLGWQANRPRPSSGPFAFNGVRVGDKVSDLEARLGPPSFKNPAVHYQQWENPLTQLSYDPQGTVIVVHGSGMGVLTQGDRILLQCGVAEAQDVLKVFGPPPGGVQARFYRYPGPAPDGSQDITIHCGSESLGKLTVSNIAIGRDKSP